MKEDSRRGLPPVNSVIGHQLLAESMQTHGRVAVRRAVRQALEEVRLGFRDQKVIPFDPTAVARRAYEILAGERPRLRPVINATGVLLHTGLGRAPLAAEAIQAVTNVATGYCNLEIDLEDGVRGRRSSGISALLRELTGAEAATVVNNNAGATVVVLRAMAAGREVIVSRGQLVEIGGSFRLPEIFEVSGARLREVGTTNKTRLSDYQRAIGPETAAILRVHRSNFQIVGFTEEPSLSDLAQLAHAHGLWAIDDIGSGALRSGLPPGIVDEPTVSQGLEADADLVLFSGDKLLGGPQCGLIVGKREAVGRVETDPLMRALRVDKMTLAALETTLRLALDPQRGMEKIPLWSMIATPLQLVRARAEALATTFREEFGLNASVITSESFIGGGSVPILPIPTVVVAVSPPFPIVRDSRSESAWARLLRQGDPPIVARVHLGQVLFDPRTVTSNQEPVLLDAIRHLCQDRGPIPAVDEPSRARPVASNQNSGTIQRMNGPEGIPVK